MLHEVISRAQSGLAASAPDAIDVSPAEAWSLLQAEPAAQLIDVRTAPEWSFVGVPVLRSIGKKLTTLSWRQFPNFAVNDDFVLQLSSAITDKTTPLFFICRTGGRSLDAALAMREAGYNACFNVAGGFEGDLDPNGRRGMRNGWKAEALPWEQS